MEIKNGVKKILVLLLVLLNFGCDQISKSIVRKNVEYYETTPIIQDNFILTKVENKGAFLGFGSSLHPVIKTVFLLGLPTVALLAMLAYLLFKTNLNQYFIIGFSFIVGGGIGNIFDRILYGSVTDFLHIDLGLFKTGIFNMADVSVMAGSLYILFSVIRKKYQQVKIQ
ncbi:signal peptidase II [Abyssalbus ytuae]|uniref:Lipoprotein signal peptidase n=1 Tax=Abyssalbus ytuae TaxID=2926907 RepID=A0A9E7CUD4_9FLAO|nr:signal peptidase II [Abyssalbus ytuae]UOB18222.1 signal peptidase II [Abyssalbus ytuae]